MGDDIDSAADRIRPLNVFILRGCDSALSFAPGSSRSEKVRAIIHSVLAARDAGRTEAFDAACNAALAARDPESATHVSHGAFLKATVWVGSSTIRKLKHALAGEFLTPSDFIKGIVLVLAGPPTSLKSEGQP